MRFIRLIPILIMTLFACAAADAQDDGEDLIRVETDLVTVNVAIRDKQGNPVKNLRREQFEIFDNRAKQQIEYFSAETSPVTYGIVYDMHPRATERMTAVLDSLRVFTKNLPAEDRFFLTAFNHYGSLTVDFVPSVEQLEKNLSLGEKNRKPNSLYDAIYAAAEKIRESPSQKKTILVISDGADHSSRHSFADLSRELKNFDAQVYAVIFDERELWGYSDLTRVGAGGQEPQQRRRISTDASRLDRVALQELTIKSGGDSRFPATENSLDLYNIYRQIASEMRDFYTLSFYPKNAADGKWHELRIGLHSVKDSKSFSLTYRLGYQSPAPRP